MPNSKTLCFYYPQDNTFAIQIDVWKQKNQVYRLW